MFRFFYYSGVEIYICMVEIKGKKPQIWTILKKGMMFFHTKKLLFIGKSHEMLTIFTEIDKLLVLQSHSTVYRGYQITITVLTEPLF